MEDKENYPAEDVENLESMEESDVELIKRLARTTLEDLSEKKNKLEILVKEKFEERLELEKILATRRSQVIAVKEQTMKTEAETAEKQKILENMKNELSYLKEQVTNLPLLAYEEHYELLVSQLGTLENVAATFSRFKSKEAIENTCKTLEIQIEQTNKKRLEDEQQLDKLQAEKDMLEKKCRSYPLKTVGVIVAALQRDLKDAQDQLRMQGK